jgi:hypothetical protein
MKWASGSRGAAAVLVVVLASGACSAPSAPVVAEGKWGRPGSSYEQFMQERYVCAQEASRQKATTSIGYYGGTAEARSVVSASLYRACMGARGWRQDGAGYQAPAETRLVLEE